MGSGRKPTGVSRFNSMLHQAPGFRLSCVILVTEDHSDLAYIFTLFW